MIRDWSKSAPVKSSSLIGRDQQMDDSFVDSDDDYRLTYDRRGCILEPRSAENVNRSMFQLFRMVTYTMSARQLGHIGYWESLQYPASFWNAPKIKMYLRLHNTYACCFGTVGHVFHHTKNQVRGLCLNLNTWTKDSRRVTLSTISSFELIRFVSASGILFDSINTLFWYRLSSDIS